jgi:hypothetical protein
MRKLILIALLLSAPNAFAALALDGSPVGKLNLSGSPTTTTLTISTTQSNDILILFVQNNNAIINTVTSTSLTWTMREETALPSVSEWYAKAASPLSSEVVTITFDTGGSSFDQEVVFAVSGANYSSPFDTNASIPEKGTTAGNPTFSTTGAATLVVSSQRFTSTATPTAGSGWTSLYGPSNGYGVSIYKAFSSAQTGTTALTSATDQNGWIVDALVPAAGPSIAPSQFFLSDNSQRELTGRSSLAILPQR